MNVEITPGVVSGRVAAPPSKSYTHRALVVGYFARRPFDVLGPLEADDTRATRRGLERLGSRIAVLPHQWSMRPRPFGRRTSSTTIDCGESGTTLRLLAGVAASTDRRVRLTGGRGLSTRPIDDLLRSLRSAGVTVDRPSSAPFPIVLTGPMRPGRFSIRGDVSSQYTSSLLLTLPNLAGPSSIEVIGRRVSEPYVAATLAVLSAHGVRVQPTDRGWRIPAPQTFTGDRFEVPGDASSSAYLWSAGALTGGTVTVTGLDPRWPQADRLILDVLRSAGASVREASGSITVSGRADRPFRVDLTPAPDLFPLVGAFAAVADGTSTLEGALHAAFKESDRRAATVDLVRRLGARCTASRDSLRIQGTRTPRGLKIRGWTDHRLVMSAAVAALAARRPSSLGDARAVGKSFPGFWSSLRRLGMQVSGRR